jgi:hypothetical protein
VERAQKIRIIGCQGSIQFITAMNVLTHYASQNDPQNTAYRNYLLIYELASPKGQDVNFYQFIRRLALSGPVKFEKIVYLRPEDLDHLHQKFSEYGFASARENLLSISGMPPADELYVCSNWQRGNKLLMNCYPARKAICYGDSIGMHIPEGYFDERPARIPVKTIMMYRKLRAFSKGVQTYLQNRHRRPGLQMIKTKKFDWGYYMTTDLTRQKPAWNYTTTEKKSLIDTFRDYASSLEIPLLSDPILQEERIAFLITTNFSESEKMTLDNEIQAYVEFLRQHLEPGASLVIKPHPRDSVQKLGALNKTLSSIYHVRVLDGVNDYFIPFEFILMQLRDRYPEKISQFNYFTFSTACLSIKVLFGQQAEVGLGKEIVNKYFRDIARAPRIQHEEDLRQLLKIQI